MAPRLLEFEATDKLFESRRTLIWRGHRLASGEPVVLKLLKPEAATESELARFRHEYQLTSKASGAPGVIRAFALEEVRASLLMAVEDIGGKSLDRHPLPLSLRPFLELAVWLADTVAQLHQRRIIHKDLNPSNIVFNLRTGQRRLIDFGVADELPQREVAPRPPAAMEGTLPYISPEQTGRMNRTVDYRTDFYSLGVSFYQLLTGRLPFEAEDALGLVHCHIAAAPAAPHLVDPRIPQAVSRIILKLMSKMAEDRYQSGWGLKADLERCLRRLQEEHRVPDFELGQHDFTDRLQPPPKLYGREKEIGRLLAPFDRVQAGGRELVLVAGYAGVGKTSLVHELHKPVLERRGSFVEGKFDQLRRNVPYSGWIQAFEGFVAYLLMESESELARWKHDILAAVGGSGRVLTEVIRNLELIIGPQPEVPELGGAEAQNRFNYLFLRLVQAIAKEHPLVVFLDDLQWIDAASLILLQTLLTRGEVARVLVVAAYRDNEVDSLHPLMQAIQALRKEHAKVGLLELGNLSEQTVDELIADAVRGERSRTAPLARLVFSKTRGNPFFTLETLRSLVERAAISFDLEARRWRWDLGALEHLQITDNVVALMAQMIETLEAKARRSLPLAACMGFRFNLTHLATIARQPEEGARESLEPALREGLIVPAGAEYQFAHDRVQQAAYSLIPEADKKTVHLEIGRLLLRGLSEHDREEQLFAVVDHLDVGASLLERDQKRELSGFNLRAGRKAKAAAAFDAAARYFEAGLDLLVEESWATDYALALELHSLAAEAATLVGHFERTDELFAEVTRRARDPIDMVDVYVARMNAFTARGELQRTLDCSLEVLGRLGVHIESHPSAEDISRALAEVMASYDPEAIGALADLPPMTDAPVRAAMRILDVATGPAYSGRPSLHALLAFEQVKLSIRCGSAPESMYAYTSLALRLCGLPGGDIDQGYEFGALALALAEKSTAAALVPKVVATTAGMIWSYKRHFRDTFEVLLSTCRRAKEVGDFEYAGYAICFYAHNAFVSGKGLVELERELAEYLQDLKHVRSEVAVRWLSAFVQAAQNLLGRTTCPWILDGEAYDRRAVLRVIVETGNRAAQGALHVNTLMLCYLFGRYDDALAASVATEETRSGPMPIGMIEPVWYFYDSLTRLALCSRASLPEKARLLERVAANQDYLRLRARHAPMGFLHQWHLVEAERARVQDDGMLAIGHYSRTIALARDNGFVQDEALANELAARFWSAQGEGEYAQLHLERAHRGYSRWQAWAKVSALESCRPELVVRQARPLRGSSALDLETVMKSARAISSEMELDRLLGVMTRILTENAGAQTGVLLLEQGGEWVVAARKEVAQTEAQQPAVSPNVIRFVSRTREWVVLDDAVSQGRFVDDPHIQQERTRSLLCAPLMSRGRLIGVLYLENNLAVGAFRDRVELLEMLLTQAATSLENARTYEALRASETKYRRMVDTTSEGVCALGPDTRTTFANARMAQMLGCSSEEILGRSLTDFMFEEDLPDHRRRMENRRRGVSETYERRFRRKDGETIWSRVSATPIFDEAGRFVGAFAMINDMTERKRAQQERERLLAAESAARHGAELAMRRLAALQRVTEAAVGGLELDELLGELLDRIAEGMQADTAAILLVSADGAWLEARAARGLEEEVERGLRLPLGHGFAGHIAAEARPIRIDDVDHAEVLNPLLREKRVRSLLGAPLLAAGRVIGVLHVGTLRPHRFDDDEERLLQAVAERVATAIERVRLQEAAEHARAEAKVSRRFAEVTEDFARMVSHDLRAPLQIITLQAQALERDLGCKGVPKLANRARAIVRSGERMTSMLGDLVESARLESGQLRLARRALALQPFLVDAIERLGAVFDCRRIALEIPEGLPLADADPDRLERIFTNLISNAFRYGGEAGPLTIAAREQDRWIEVSVADRGPGIAEDLLPHLFNRFTRGATPRVEGLGLGLYITRLLVEAHGGRIWAHNRPEGGCCFTFTLEKAWRPAADRGAEATSRSGA